MPEPRVTEPLSVGRLEIAEEQRDLVGIVVGVRFPQGVGINP